MLTIQQLIHLKKRFGTDEAIGNYIGVTRQAIHQKRTKYGIPSDRANLPERNEKIRNEFHAGASIIFLSKKYGLSITQTYRVTRG